MEEFQEADILWPDSGSGDDQDRNNSDVKEGDAASIVLSSVRSNLVSPPDPSAPVEISRRKRRCRPWASSEPAMLDEIITAVIDQDEEACCTDDGANERYTDCSTTIVPPHVLVARRRLVGGRTAAYSMCAGKGRTLKGRDLRDVRNRVLKMTGFIEK
jgi:hypothetical protein